MDLYSAQNRPAPANLRYDFPMEVRKRLFHTLEGLLRGEVGGMIDMRGLFAELHPQLLRAYGHLAGEGIRLQEPRYDPVSLHFQCCDPAQFLDFLQLTFQSRCYRSGQRGVEQINSILRECGIGYEFTPWVEHLGKKIDMGPGTASGARELHIEYPRAVKLDHLHQHEATVRPCLHILSDLRFQTANAEMLKAHDDYRHGRYDDAITSCGAAFESTLKTICSLKGWTFDADRDACSQLVSICRANGLFPGYYAPIFEATGTIRNKLSDAHGRGPTPQYTVGKEHVQHVLQMTSAHIILLVALAKL